MSQRASSSSMTSTRGRCPLERSWCGAAIARSGLGKGRRAVIALLEMPVVLEQPLVLPAHGLVALARAARERGGVPDADLPAPVLDEAVALERSRGERDRGSLDTDHHREIFLREQIGRASCRERV